MFMITLTMDSDKTRITWLVERAQRGESNALKELVELVKMKSSAACSLLADESISQRVSKLYKGNKDNPFVVMAQAHTLDIMTLILKNPNFATTLAGTIIETEREYYKKKETTTALHYLFYGSVYAHEDVMPHVIENIELLKIMANTKDSEGNTPFHILVMSSEQVARTIIDSARDVIALAKRTKNAGNVSVYALARNSVDISLNDLCRTMD